ncbi:19.5g6 protein [Bracoviriform inaniti]|uniref:19.5g6 protein n=1 Tax=Bracoviriform inaniti TaxID=36344 RepID=A8E101_9VIRU|nr:19.5g6 protein [Bracoviriform inaniti]CAO98971.1 19.5g6 protein [Bracoviriform inaniti]
MIGVSYPKNRIVNDVLNRKHDEVRTIIACSIIEHI